MSADPRIFQRSQTLDQLSHLVLCELVADHDGVPACLHRQDGLDLPRSELFEQALIVKEIIFFGPLTQEVIIRHASE